MNHGKFLFPYLMLASFLICFLSVQSAHSHGDSLGFIFIRPDGRIEPAQAPIQNIGGVYTFTGNIYDPIVLERDNIILNGAGYYLQGNGTGTPLTQVSSGTGPTIYLVGRDNGIGINITCSNVIIMNIHIVNWVAGINGAYDNNTIAANFITNCQIGIKIFGANYTITGNYIGTNNERVRLAASQTQIKRNNLTGNQVGLRINYSNHTITENNLSNVNDDIVGQWTGGVVVYHNNFLNGDTGRHLQFDTGHSGVSPNAVWDNGYPSGGNYWPDNTGTDANDDGIGDTPYQVKSVYNYPNIPNMSVSSVVGIDNYPLMKPFAIPAYTPILPTSNPSPTNPTSTPTPTSLTLAIIPTPSPSVPEFPLWAVLPILISSTAFFIVAKKRKKQNN
jgi:hypothetical protein